jgi:hypothetical protein
MAFSVFSKYLNNSYFNFIISDLPLFYFLCTSTYPRTSLGWFAHQPEWYDVNIPNFCHSEALSVSVFVHFLSNELSESSQSDSKGKPRESGNLIDVVRQRSAIFFYFHL